MAPRHGGWRDMARRPGSTSRAVTHGNARYQAWQTMRLWKKAGQAWSVPDLAAVIEAAEVSNLKVYLRGLHRAGFVSQVERANPFRRRPAKWRLVRDTGPNPPRLRQDGTVYDPNTRTVWRDGVEAADD